MNPKDRREVDIIDLLLVLSKSKGRILQITIAIAIIATATSWLLPKMYTATSTILPPEESQSSLTSLLGQFGAFAGVSSKDLGFKNSSDLFVAMLKSRTIEDRLVDRFDLRKVYGVKFYQDARKKLEGRSHISAGDEGLISVSVTDRDPMRAAELANAYVAELHSVNENLAITEAGQRRLFYEQKLDEERRSLAQAEQLLKQSQEKSGLIQLDAQGKAIVEAVADMRAQVAIHEVQLESMRTYATENNPAVRRAERELAELRAQLVKLERNTGDVGNGNLEVPTRQLPEVQLEYLRRARDLKYHEALYEFLGKQLEAARIDEAKDAILLQVVDKAVPPEKRSSPRRLLIILLSTAGGFLLACLGALSFEALKRKMQDPENHARLALLRHYLTSSSGRL
jgi:uncharacterized protein involved in exopolysaccharide biosynthesis